MPRKGLNREASPKRLPAVLNNDFEMESRRFAHVWNGGSSE